jgi:hypothetical protein
MKFIDLLGKERLFFDGAMGTMLQKNGFLPAKFPKHGILLIGIPFMPFTRRMRTPAAI